MGRALKNCWTGRVESDGVDDVAFDMQYHEFQRSGYAHAWLPSPLYLCICKHLGAHKTLSSSMLLVRAGARLRQLGNAARSERERVVESQEAARTR